MYVCLQHVQVYEMFDSDPASWAALVAQLVEHLSGVQSVVGSNPTWGNSHFHFSIASGVSDNIMYVHVVKKYL